MNETWHIHITITIISSSIALVPLNHSWERHKIYSNIHQAMLAKN